MQYLVKTAAGKQKTDIASLFYRRLPLAVGALPQQPRRSVAPDSTKAPPWIHGCL